METALVLPLLLMVVFAMIDFGRMLNAQIKVTEAAREGARALALVDDNAAGAVAGTVMDTARSSTLDAGSWTGVPTGDCTVAGTHRAMYEVDYGFEFITPITVFAHLTVGDDGYIRLNARAVLPCRA
ncbi:Flp pilus assembly protein TadG [Catenuloplanes nepalensis]|uniref:Flp pilus assembly protein TadG n=1 Tax=Catenuloplanes nepalensis TaxID=587533 RepID=A0ABT9N4E3_9ACTN|nr:Flp pilus assembly protein TadG [Catenuloplanes nepalensis]